MHRLRAGAAAALVLLAACSTPTPSVAPSAGPGTPPPASSGPTAGPVATPIGPVATPSAGQVETAWGRIWEAVPEGFPVPPGAQEAEADEVVSAAYGVSTAALPNPREVVAFYGDAFSRAGFSGSIDGPFEDGSYTAVASDGQGQGCDILVTARPRGPEESYVTVMYGAGCPFDWPG